MKIFTPLLACVTLVLILFACHKSQYKDYSAKGDGKFPVDLMADYPFGASHCGGDTSTLAQALAIVDTSWYQPVSSDPLPSSLLLDMPPVGNQGGQSSAAAWAATYALGSYYVHLTTGKPYSDTGNLSPKYTYNQIVQGTCRCTSLIEHLDLLKKQGASSLGVMPYNTECALQPDTKQRVNAATYKINGWQRIWHTDTVLIKRALLDKKPVAFTIKLDEKFQSIKAPYIWKDFSSPQGCHPMVVIGYDDSKSAFKVQNSWSKNWADKGCVWIDYKLFTQKTLDGVYIVR
jgi:C1A family cysteine protease